MLHPALQSTELHCVPPSQQVSRSPLRMLLRLKADLVSYLLKKSHIQLFPETNADALRHFAARQYVAFPDFLCGFSMCPVLTYRHC